MCVSTMVRQIRGAVKDRKTNLAALTSRGLTVRVCVCVYIHVECMHWVVNRVRMCACASICLSESCGIAELD